jgi:hypothetical protein
MPNPESIMCIKAQSTEGWLKLESPYPCRTIQIGYLKNCNDELVIDLKLKSVIENIFKNRNISDSDYELIETKNNNLYSFNIRLKEYAYDNFKKSLDI